MSTSQDDDGDEQDDVHEEKDFDSEPNEVIFYDGIQNGLRVVEMVNNKDHDDFDSHVLRDIVLC